MLGNGAQCFGGARGEGRFYDAVRARRCVENDGDRKERRKSGGKGRE